MNKFFVFIILIMIMVFSSFIGIRAYNDGHHFDLEAVCKRIGDEKISNLIDKVEASMSSGYEFEVFMAKLLEEINYVHGNKICECVENGTEYSGLAEVFSKIKEIRVLNLVSLAMQLKNIDCKEEKAKALRGISVKDSMQELKKKIKNMHDIEDYSIIKRHAQKTFKPKTISDSLDSDMKLRSDNLCDCVVSL